MVTRILDIAYEAPYFHDFSFILLFKCHHVRLRGLTEALRRWSEWRIQLQKKPEITGHFY